MAGRGVAGLTAAPSFPKNRPSPQRSNIPRQAVVLPRLTLAAIATDFGRKVMAGPTDEGNPAFPAAPWEQARVPKHPPWA